MIFDVKYNINKKQLTTKMPSDKMKKVFCHVIMTKTNNSEKRCRNYARKGMDCCFSHRKLEVENPEEVIHELVKNICDKVIYNLRMDCIRENGWDHYVEMLRNGQI